MLRNLLISGAVFALALTAGANQAWAGWGSHGWSYGSYGGSHGSWGSHSSYGSYGSHGSRGSYGSMGSHGNVRYYGHGGFASRWYYRHASTRYHRFGSWGSHHMGNYGSFGSHGSHGSHGTVISSCGSSGGGAVIYQKGVEQKSEKPATETETNEADPTPMDTRLHRGDATLTVHVPSDAKVFVNGHETRTTGDARKFVSRDLEKGFNYTYEIRVEAVRDGEIVESNRTVKLTAGDNIDVTLKPDSVERVASTTVEVHVPEGAKVFLANTPTKSTGPVRVFRTTKLKRGETWDGYTVRVEMEENGRIVSKEKKVKLVGGDLKVVRFEASRHVAAASR